MTMDEDLVGPSFQSLPKERAGWNDPFGNAHAFTSSWRASPGTEVLWFMWQLNLGTCRTHGAPPSPGPADCKVEHILPAET